MADECGWLTRVVESAAAALALMNVEAAGKATAAISALHPIVLRLFGILH
jgi:hypothetical protein